MYSISLVFNFANLKSPRYQIPRKSGFTVDITILYYTCYTPIQLRQLMIPLHTMTFRCSCIWEYAQFNGDHDES